MKRCIVALGMVLVMVILVIMLGPVSAGAAGALDACSLLTKADAESGIFL